MPQTREHILLGRQVGVPYIIVFLNTDEEAGQAPVRAQRLVTPLTDGVQRKERVRDSKLWSVYSFGKRTSGTLLQYTCSPR